MRAVAPDAPGAKASGDPFAAWKTFYTLLNQLRLDDALSRLNAQRHASRIDEIASASGCNSLSTFYRCFKQKTGCSPKAYLQQLSRPE
ncbi:MULTISPECIES: AraC family transcriptional regulator [unclassified Pseudomonas]|uniref:helix-turn-helix domain-containing protein n=1 Tax=Pseudomonas sp. ACM7 TaxID=2052956 RepID=UPI002113F94D|nr:MULTISPECIES: helix-turn-helix domain-containing protein [unclassified Pseudomonas]